MPWEVSVSTHIDEETEALALLRVPGCPGAQPAQAFLPGACQLAQPWLVSLTLSSAICIASKLALGMWVALGQLWMAVQGM